MRLEAERELEERRKADEKVLAEQRAKELEEERKRADEQRRIAQEEERRREAARREREEAARLDAIREAERERARAEAEHKARMDALKLQQEHEQALALLGRDKSKRRAKGIAIVSVLLCVGLAVAGGLVIRAQMHKTAELEGRIAAYQTEIDETNDKIRRSTSPEERQRLEDQLADLQRQRDALAAGAKVVPPQPKATTQPTVVRPQPKGVDVCEEIRKNPNDPRRFDPANGCL